MRIRTGVTGVLALAVAAGALGACTPSKFVPNAGVLRRADGALAILVAPCRDHGVSDVILHGSPAPASSTSTGWWWIEAPGEPERPWVSRTVRDPVEVVPFQAPAGWTIQHRDLQPPMQPGVTYSVGGFLQGRYRHQATGPSFTLADLDRLRPGEVYAEPRRGRGGERPIVLSRTDFEDRASGAC